MRAAVLHDPGEIPEYAEHPGPSAEPGMTLVRVTAAPIVPLDLLCASGTSYFGRPRTPYVPGVQGVGVVERSQSLPQGTRVWFATSAGMAPGDGSLAESCAVPDADVVPLAGAGAETVADEAVAALGLSAVAAWMALTLRARLEPGERVAVLGGGGAVGQAAIGAARRLGAARVVAVCRSQGAIERARRAGADDVVAVVPDSAALAADLIDALGGPADVVVDPVWGPVASAAAQALGTGGRLVNLGSSGAEHAELSSAVLRSKAASVLGYTNNALTPQQRAEALGAVIECAAAGAMAVEHSVLPLERVADGWRDTAAGSGPRVVLTPTGAG